MITVVVPAYNAEKYIAKNLESLSRQSFGQFEVIVIDDFSVDSTVNEVKSYAKKIDRLRVVELKSNGGQGAARNLGISLAKGDYILFLDADDYLQDNALERLFETAVLNDSDMVFCDWR